MARRAPGAKARSKKPPTPPAPCHWLYRVTLVRSPAGSSTQWVTKEEAVSRSVRLPPVGAVDPQAVGALPPSGLKAVGEDRSRPLAPLLHPVVPELLGQDAGAPLPVVGQDPVDLLAAGRHLALGSHLDRRHCPGRLPARRAGRLGTPALASLACGQ